MEKTHARHEVSDRLPAFYMSQEINMNDDKVYIETIGCQMNVADSERAVSSLRAAGYEIVRDLDLADVALFNTCSVRERAEQKVYKRVNEVQQVRYKRSLIVGLMGCVAQLEGDAIFDHAPGVRLVIGTRATGRLPESIEFVKSGKMARVLDIGERSGNEIWNVSLSARASNRIAVVPIIEGCDKFCSYCIVPFSRGRERSREASDIIHEVKELIENEFLEVQLVGQNVNSYRPATENGLEQFEGTTPFSRLLRAVAHTGIKRIRFTTSFPRDFHPDIISAMEENHNLCDWIHLPIQSGSDHMLKAMRRGYKVEDYLAKIEVIKNARRKFSITSDIIIGFPGETKEDFARTVDLVKLCQYDSLYIFKYSQRGGTPASALVDSVPESEKSDRFEILKEVQQRIQKKIYESYVERTVSVLVEGVSARAKTDVTGHTTCNKVINFPGDAETLVGSLINVRVRNANPNSLYGYGIENEIRERT